MSKAASAPGTMSKKSREEFLKRMSNVLYEVRQLSSVYNDKKPLLDNYNWRAVALGMVLQAKEPRIRIMKSRTKTDCKIGRDFKNIEIKTCTLKSKSSPYVSKSDITAEFDKQDRVGALKKLLAFDGLIIGVYNDEDACPVITIWITKAGMAELATLLEARHKAFKAGWTSKGRDSIHLKYDDIAKKVTPDNVVAFVRRKPIGLTALTNRLTQGNIKAYGR